MTGRKTKITVKGVEYESIAAMCRHYGIIRSRWNDAFKKTNSPDEALDMCLEYEPGRTKKVSIDGMTFGSIDEAASYYKLNPCSVYTKMSRCKVTADKAISMLIGSRFMAPGKRRTSENSEEE